MTNKKPFWETVPSREDEGWWITARANSEREKRPPAPNPWRPGFERRSRRDTAEVLKKLAALQKRYDPTDDQVQITKLARHAMLLLLPMFTAGQKKLCQFTGEPCSKLKDDPKTGLVRCQLRRGRYTLVWQLLIQHAQKFGPAGDDEYSWPIISVREREKREIWPTQRQRHTQRRNADKQFVIGMAVLRRYRDTARPGNSVGAAFVDVANVGLIEGLKTGGRDNVEKLYRAFRITCFERGYADERAYRAQYHAEPWPKDQLWLSDFPQISEG